ncbi:MAG: EF-hand domain-containing protein [Verrucomicrobiae bacterium]|nr:EF-hand domain-containing protein [Verrucomicrobiae bacterium]
MKTSFSTRPLALALLGLALGVLPLPAPAASAPKADTKNKNRPPEDSRTVVVDGVKYTVPAGPQEGSANALLLKKFDLNGDGKIDEAEIAAAQAAATNRAQPFPKAADDRRLTPKDLYEGGDPARRRATAKIGSDDLLRQYDKNGDGQLDAAEFQKLKDDLSKGGSHRELRPETPPPPPPKPQPVVKPTLR